MGFENLLLGFQIAFQPYNLLLAVVGITLGTIIGVLPGLGGANGVAILLPLTFSMPPNSAIILLTSLYWGALFGGAITSVLFNIPGEPWSVATTFDGFPMAQRGQPRQVAGVHPHRLHPGRSRARHRDRDAPADLRRYRADEGLRFHRRRDRPLRHRRDSAHDGGGLVLPGNQGEDQPEGGVADLESFAPLLPDLHPLGLHRVLDGLQAWRRHAGLLHELRLRQAVFQTPGALRQGRDRGRGGAGDRRPRGRRRLLAPDDHPRHSRLTHGGGDAGRAHHLGAPARPHAVQGEARLRLGPHRQHVHGQCHRRPHGTGLRAVLRGDPPDPVRDPDT